MTHRWMEQYDMNKFLWLSFTLLCLTGCGSTYPERHTYQGYSGPVKNDSELALYNLMNNPYLVESIPVVTMEVDEVDYHIHPNAMTPSLGAIGIIKLLPGKHNIKVSFVDIDMALIPTWIDSSIFQGFYEFNFDAKAGKFYSAIYKSLDEKYIYKEICLVEADQSSGTHFEIMKASWKSSSYVQCVEPSMEPTEDNIKLCSKIQAAVVNPAYDKACRTQVYQRTD